MKIRPGPFSCYFGLLLLRLPEWDNQAPGLETCQYHSLPSTPKTLFIVFTWDCHNLDSHTTINEIPESLPVLWIRVPEKPGHINNQSHTRVLTQKSPNSIGAFPTGTPGQEPGDGAANGWAILSFCSKLFYKIDFHMVGGVFA